MNKPLSRRTVFAFSSSLLPKSLSEAFRGQPISFTAFTPLDRMRVWRMVVVLQEGDGVVLFLSREQNELREQIALLQSLHVQRPDLKIIAIICRDKDRFTRDFPTGAGLLNAGATTALGYFVFDASRIAKAIRDTLSGDLKGSYHLSKERTRRATDGVLPASSHFSGRTIDTGITMHERQWPPTTWDTRRKNEEQRRHCSPRIPRHDPDETVPQKTKKPPRPLPPWTSSYFSEVRWAKYGKLELLFHGIRIVLTQKAFVLLDLLSSKEGTVFSMNEICDVLDYENPANSARIIAETRAAFSRSSLRGCIRNKPGEGYSFTSPEDPKNPDPP